MLKYAGRPTPLVVILLVLVATSACRLSYLVAAHTVGYGGVQRHHVETTATIFAVLGAALAFANRRPADPPSRAVAVRVSAAWLLPAFCAAAVVLYWPVLFIGPLSDDFVLMHRASSWDLSAVSSTLFRPIPLLLWAGVLATGAGTIGLHALNVVLHGVNAWLTSRVIDEWVPSSPSAALMSGLLMLTAPLAPEAVAWASGIFDVSATTLVLTSVFVARAYRHGLPRPGTRALFIVTSALAVLCKESAAVAPLLALVCAPLARSAPGRSMLRRDAVLVMVLIAVFGAIRMAVHPEPSLFQVSKYAVQRTLFAAFGSLASPFHSDVVGLVPWLAVGSTVLVICLWTVFFVTPAANRDLATVARGLAWILIAIAPVWPILVVPADLQASRYLYLAGVGWAVLLVRAASAPARGAVARAPGLALSLIVVIAAGATRVHLWHWQDAAVERDLAIDAIVDARAQRGCAAVSIANPPDTVRGAYVFRNGLAEALAARGVALVDSAPRPDCAFSWNEDRGVLVQR